MAQGINEGISDFKLGYLEMLYRKHGILKVNWDFSWRKRAQIQQNEKTKQNTWENIEQLWTSMAHSGNKVQSRMIKAYDIYRLY